MAQMAGWNSLANIFLASAIPIVLIGGFWTRHLIHKSGGKGGIGWQYIRYTVLALSLPIIGLLALNNALSSEAATVIAASVGFAFGRRDDS
ncbi:MAG: hypothetical protein OXE44_02365 [Nitrospinae bacterium]|nr:hypothetical protein [Nitrospinota bacterium]